MPDRAHRYGPWRCRRPADACNRPSLQQEVRGKPNGALVPGRAFLLQGKFREGSILKICVLASSSAGNSTFIGTANTHLLVDAGLSRRETAARLALIGESIDDLDGILVSHEHTDHVSSLWTVAKRREKRQPVPVYATEATFSALAKPAYEPAVEKFCAGLKLVIGDIEVQTYTTPHDAVDPIGFCFHTQGLKAGLVTDLGYMPDSIRYYLRETDFLILESNHDLEMLKVGPYPWQVKQRVMGRKGHLSNDVASEFIRQDMAPATQTIVLGHLSEQNNHPELARLAAAQAIEGRGLAVKLVVALPRKQTEVFQL